MIPTVGQRATFYPGGGLPPVAVFVDGVLDDACVNLRGVVTHMRWVDVPVVADGKAATSGYYCTLAAAPETMAQPKITGYRQLSEREAALMNEGKALAEAVGSYVEKLQAMNGMNREGDALALDQRWITIGKTDLQRGFMAVIRGIARPTTF